MFSVAEAFCFPQDEVCLEACFSTGSTSIYV
jgi:hypothetical protein